MVTDVPEPGIVTLSSLQPQVGAPLTATLDRPRSGLIDTAGNNQRYLEVGEVPGHVLLDGVIDSSRVKPTRTPDATTGGYYLRATATYDDREEDRAGSVGQQGAGGAYYCGRPRCLPRLPEDENQQDRSVAENSPAGTNVGDPVKATDTTDDVLTYSLTGRIRPTVPGGFQINPATGQITVGPRTILDADVHPSADLHRHGHGEAVTEAGEAPQRLQQ